MGGAGLVGMSSMVDGNVLEWFLDADSSWRDKHSMPEGKEWGI